MSALQRNLILNQFFDKLSKWKTPETKLLYFKDLAAGTTPWMPEFAIERDSNGYFYISDTLIAYCNLKNGSIFRLRSRWGEKDWVCYSELADIANQTKEFRIDIPLHRELVRVENADWEYAELRSPNLDYGKNYNDDVFEWPELTNGQHQDNEVTDEFQDSVVQYHKEFIDQAIVILKYTDQIAKKHGTGFPRNLCRPTTRYKDSVGYFWSDFDHNEWSMEKASAIDYYHTIFKGTLNFSLTCGVIDYGRMIDCTNYARSKWITI
jgi:hypothetical protein